MAAGSSNSAAGVLTQLSELVIHPVMNRTTKLTIPLVSFHLPQGQVLPRLGRRQSQRVKHGMEIAAVPQL